MNQNSTEQNLLIVLSTMHELAKGPSGTYSEDSGVADKLGWDVEEVADCMDILAERGLTNPSNSAAGRCASLSANGRASLKDLQYQAAFIQVKSQIKPVSNIEIFISHSSKDRDLAKALADLLAFALSIKVEKIRCTSVPGYKLDAGAITADTLRQEINDSTVFIGLITPNSIDSSYVLFELGARWGSGGDSIPLLAAGAKSDVLPGTFPGLNALKCEREDVIQLLRNIASQLAIELNNTEAYLKMVDAVVRKSNSEARKAARAAKSSDLQNGPSASSRTQKKTQLVLSKDEMLWLQTLSSRTKLGESLNSRELFIELLPQISRDFVPKDIDGRFCSNGSTITLLGRALVNPQDEYVQQANVVLRTVRNILEKDPDKSVISANEIALDSSVSEVEVVQVLGNTAGFRGGGGFHESGYSYGATGYSAINIDTRIFQRYIKFESIEKILKEELAKAGEQSANPR